MIVGACLFWTFAIAHLPVAWLVRRLVRGPGQPLAVKLWLFTIGCAAASGVLVGVLMEASTLGEIDLPRTDIVHDETPLRW